MATYTTFTYTSGPDTSSNDTILSQASYGNNTSTLLSVIIGSSVTSLGRNCFRDCSKLTSINIPSSVQTLGIACFFGDVSLNTVTFVPSSVCSSLGNQCFQNCSNLTSINIPSSVQTLGAQCFQNCSNLTSINIPSSVQTLGAQCFYGCSNLTSINIPSSVFSLSNYCFYRCSKLTSINIPSSVQTLGDFCFFGDVSLNTVTFDPSSVCTSLGTQCFLSCSSLTSINIPSSVTSLGSSCFQNCSNLTSINIPSSVFSLSNNCFYGCSKLTSINIPSSVQTLGAQCFRNCSNLTSIDIPSSVQTLGSSCFQNCTRLRTMYFENQSALTDISSNLFASDSSMNVTFYNTDSSANLSNKVRTELLPQFPVDSAFFYNPSCFNYDTKILTDKGYLPIQDLKKGVLVKTYKHGFKPIALIGSRKMINNPNMQGFCMHKMVKTDENGLLEDLIVTGYHSILVDDLGELCEENKKYSDQVKVEDKFLLSTAVSKDFVKLEDTNEYTYYHFALENEDPEERFGVWANGVLTETTPISHFKRKFHEYC